MSKRWVECGYEHMDVHRIHYASDDNSHTYAISISSNCKYNVSMLLSVVFINVHIHTRFFLLFPLLLCCLTSKSLGN